MAQFNVKAKALYFGLQTAENAGVGTTNGTSLGTIATPAVTGTAGQFSCTADTLYVGMEIVITGTNGGTATGVVAGTYFIIATNGSTTFTLSATRSGSGIVTTAGTITVSVLTKVGLGSTTAIACSDIGDDRTIDTGSFSYLGDPLSRDEFTYVKDQYIQLTADAYQLLVDKTATAISPNTESIWKVLQTCAGNVYVDATTKEVFVDNASTSPDFGLAHVRLSTSDDPTNDKMYIYSDLRGSVDVVASVGEVPSLKFTLKGNSYDPVAAAKQSPSFGTQVTSVAPPVMSTTMKNAQLIDITTTETFAATGLTGNTALTLAYAEARVVATLTTHDIPVGTIRRIRVAGASVAACNGDFVAYALTATKLMYYAKGVTGTGTATGATLTKGQTIVPQAFCFSTFNATNYLGFDYQRAADSCLQGFSKEAVATDISVMMREDQVGSSTFNPDANITKFFAAIVKFGNSSSTVAYMQDKLQIANVKKGTIGNNTARDVSFRNTGSSFIFWQ